MLDREIVLQRTLKLSDFIGKGRCLDKVKLLEALMNIQKVNPSELTIEIDLLEKTNINFSLIKDFLSCFDELLPSELQKLNVNLVDALLVYGDTPESIEILKTLTKNFFASCPPSLASLNIYKNKKTRLPGDLDMRYRDHAAHINGPLSDSRLEDICSDILNFLPRSISSLYFTGSLRLCHLKKPEELIQHLPPSITEFTVDFRDTALGDDGDKIDIERLVPVLQAIEESPSLDAVKLFGIYVDIPYHLFRLNNLDEFTQRGKDIAALIYNMDNLIIDDPLFLMHYRGAHFSEKIEGKINRKHPRFDLALISVRDEYVPKERAERPPFPSIRSWGKNPTYLLLHGYLAYFGSDENPLNISDELRVAINALLKAAYLSLSYEEGRSPEEGAVALLSNALIETMRLIMNPQVSQDKYRALIREMQDYGNSGVFSHLVLLIYDAFNIRYSPRKFFAPPLEAAENHKFRAIYPLMEQLLQHINPNVGVSARFRDAINSMHNSILLKSDFLAHVPKPLFVEIKQKGQRFLKLLEELKIDVETGDPVAGIAIATATDRLACAVASGKVSRQDIVDFHDAVTPYKKTTRREKIIGALIAIASALVGLIAGAVAGTALAGPVGTIAGAAVGFSLGAGMGTTSWALLWNRNHRFTQAEKLAEDISSLVEVGLKK